MKHAITVDFGSTFTKVVVTDLSKKTVLLSDKVPSSVGTDATICMNQCFDSAKTVLSDKEFEDALKLASSSAAGGLRMSVVGITPSLSTLAGKSAALGAGAKILANYDGIMTEDKIRELEESKTEIILMCGGYEHGNTSAVLKNAQLLAESDIRVPVIYAGNSDIDKEIRAIMRTYKKQCFIVENMIPRLGELNVAPVQDVIRNLFLERITDMKGFNEAKHFFDNDMMPTPAAVLAAGELLTSGTPAKKGLGPLMIVDVGGATTDVYSFNENKTVDGAKKVGLEAEFGKRTVEGDLGMRETSGSVINEDYFGSAVKEIGIEDAQLKKSLAKRVENISFMPDSELESKIDDTIARCAVHAATRRHAGRVKPSYNKRSCMIQTGKNLTEVSTIIGTGGIIVFNRDPSSILKSAEKTMEDKGMLLPEKIETYIDTEYVLFSAGLLREIDEDAAIEIMLKSIKRC